MDVKTLADLQALLDAAGVRYFTAREITWLPKAKPDPRCEIPQDPEHFENLVRVAILCDAIREEVGEPLTVSSGYRPDWYNRAVGGANPTETDPGSAHLRAAALDLNAKTSGGGLRLRSVCYKRWKLREFDGYGVYAKAPRRVHVEVKHAGGKGHRRWTY